jgi:hypothetical protein
MGSRGGGHNGQYKTHTHTHTHTHKQSEFYQVVDVVKK